MSKKNPFTYSKTILVPTAVTEGSNVCKYTMEKVCLLNN